MTRYEEVFQRKVAQFEKYGDYKAHFIRLAWFETMVIYRENNEWTYHIAKVEGLD